MRTFHIQLLGDFHLLYGGEHLTIIDTPRPQSVLAYLLLHRQAPQPRRHVAFTLWPASTESQAHTNLRKQLYHLRRVLPDADRFLYIDDHVVRWQTDAPFWLDIAEFERAVAAAGQSAHTGDMVATRATLEKALDLYQGDLLPNNYDEWILMPRERLSRMHLRAIDQLVRLLEAQREYAEAIHHVQRMLRHDPLRETTYRRLMRLYALSGDRARALQVYHRCATVLERELDVKPSHATRVAYERLLARGPVTMPSMISSAPCAAAAPLVGRQRAWAQLQATWCTTARSGPHFALVTGEAGIGKTRLAEELLLWAERQGIAAASTRSFAAEGPLAYAPVIGWLRTDTLQSAILQLDDVWLIELARLLPELLAERPELPHPEPLAESWRRQRLFEAIARAVLTASQPLLLFIDDLQWSDKQTLAWLHYLLRFDLQAKLLVLGTVRPEEVMEDQPLSELLVTLRADGQLTEIDLGRLDEAQTAILAGHAAGRELGAGESVHLYRETEGNPLFVMETLRAGLLDSPTTPPRAPIPPFRQEKVLQTLSPKVHAVIEHRLKQLSAEGRALAELLAVIGREFTFDLIAQASERGTTALIAALDELWQRRIVREHEGNVYDFSHDKIRQVTYDKLSPVRRRHLHSRVAGALEAVSTDHLAEVAGDLARHYTAAGETEKAVAYRLAAGKRALALSAHQEATSHFRQGLALLKTLPGTTDRNRMELAFWMALGSALVPQKGYTDPEVRQVYDRAASLVRRMGDESRLVPVLYGLGQYYSFRGEWRTTRTLGEQCLHLAQQTQEPNALLLAHGLLGFALSYAGQPARAMEHLAQSLRYYERQPASPAAGTDLGVLYRCHLALVLWSLGCLDQSLVEMDAAFRLAHDLSHPYSLATVLIHAGGLSMLRREPQQTQAYQEKATALCVEYQFPYWQAYSRMLQGWALSQQGRSAEGLAEAQRGLKIFVAIGANSTPYTYPLLAQVYANAGDITKGLRTASEAVAAAAHSGQRCVESMALRIKGDLLWQQGATPETVEACYRQAIDVAQAQGSKSFELQATMALCRLWQHQCRGIEARQCLTGIYDWFDEGFDMPDLEAARALLEELL